ncbi:hypothetical protein BJ878DRAFT_576483 [Calycina marina]|uniref:Uncharacterized protein n=1 Tax=Calycina marina TaxID=1763456 RepID=A0A9P8CE92_9HELO|nr:hypothetical protein BJ878DRAFT_576483 [Calycina marina]
MPKCFTKPRIKGSLVTTGASPSSSFRDGFFREYIVIDAHMSEFQFFTGDTGETGETLSSTGNFELTLFLPTQKSLRSSSLRQPSSTATLSSLPPVPDSNSPSKTPPSPYRPKTPHSFPYRHGHSYPSPSLPDKNNPRQPYPHEKVAPSRRHQHQRSLLPARHREVGEVELDLCRQQLEDVFAIKLTQNQTAFDREINIAQVEATRATEIRDEELRKNVEIQSAQTKLERLRASDIVKAIIFRRSKEQAALARKYEKSQAAAEYKSKQQRILADKNEQERRTQASFLAARGKPKPQPTRSRWKPTPPSTEPGGLKEIAKEYGKSSNDGYILMKRNEIRFLC